MSCFCFCSLRANAPCDDSFPENDKTRSQHQGKSSSQYQEEKPMVTTNSRSVPKTKTLDGSHHVCDGLRSSPSMSAAHSWKPYTGPSFDAEEPSPISEKMETATPAILARAAVITISPRQNNNNNTSHYSNSPLSRPSSPTPYSHSNHHHHHHNNNNNNAAMPTTGQRLMGTTTPPRPRSSRRSVHRPPSPPSPEPPQHYPYDSLQASYLLDHLRMYLHLPTSHSSSSSSSSTKSYASQSPAQTLASLLITWPSVRRNLPRRNGMLAKHVGRVDWAGAQYDLPKGSGEREAVELWLDSGLELFGKWWGPWEPLEEREQLGRRRRRVGAARRPSPLRNSMSSSSFFPSSSSSLTTSQTSSAPSYLCRKRSVKVHRERNKFRRMWKQ
ncbi:hypothetical protein VTJ49DRAFT_7000 [Mycothermus thermophilus]|uniref:Uncharacterized protein n=1 Tax=Humicola insolens TaxID=85995 RepID=A0ABR3VHY9_HUMIN